MEDNISKNVIQELINTKPKHYAKIIQNKPELLAILVNIDGNTIPEKVYNYLNDTTAICKYGNRKKLNTITTGYKFCGKASQCQCTREAVSSNVSISKQQYTTEKNQEINHKRKLTILSTYGVENIGQADSTKIAHRQAYTNKDLVDGYVLKAKQTKLAKYGDENFTNIEKMKATFKEKYSVDYWCERLNNDNLKILNDKNQLEELYKNHSIVELADLLQVHIQTIYKYLNVHNLRNPFQSSEEFEIAQFIESLGVTVIRNTRKLLPSRREIDIYLPDFNIAIEYNGIYWHHEDVAHITKTYHYDKFVECEQLGIQLITVFSTFWLYKKDIVKQSIINKLGIVSDKIPARKCIISKLATKDIRDFLNSHHIQGYTTSSFNYGLLYNNVLVAVMTFGNTRIGVGKREDGFELIRFASSVRVIGGAGKLLSHFIKTHKPEKIISYSDNEWSDGNLYKTLGFTLETVIKPSYWYVKPRENKIYHRFNFAKQKLVQLGYNSALTERAITKEMGLLKLWDCGKKRWVLIC